MRNIPDAFLLTVAELARKLQRPYEGDGKVKITGWASLEQARPGDLVFLSKAKFRDRLEKTQASAALLPPGEKFGQRPVIRSPEPYHDFVRVVQMFYRPYRPRPGIHARAQVAETAQLGSDVTIGAYAVIGEDVRIGDGSVIFPHVSIFPGTRLGKKCILHSHAAIRENCLIGNRVIIHNGAVIGSDGFGYIKDSSGRHLKVPQTGRVIIHDDVEVGANSTVDRAALDDTVIGKGTKIDNLVQIAHNVIIGENCILMSQAGVAGSSRLGNNVIVSGQVGIADHLTIEDNVILAAKTGVTNDIPSGTIAAGYPHLEIRTWRKAWASIPRLFDLIRDIRKMKKRLDALEKIKSKK